MGISPAAPSHIRLGEQRQRLHEVFSLQQGSSDASAVPLMPPMSEAAQDVFKLVDKLEQDEDVQKVYHNMK